MAVYLPTMHVNHLLTQSLYLLLTHSPCGYVTPTKSRVRRGHPTVSRRAIFDQKPHLSAPEVTRCVGPSGGNPAGRSPGSLTVWGAKPWARSPPGIRLLQIPAMAPSRGDVRSSPTAYPAVRPLPKLPLPVRPVTCPTTTADYLSGQNESNRSCRHRRPTPLASLGSSLV